MRETTFREFFNGCAIDHDENCADGPNCATRDNHIHSAYMPRAMANEIDMLRAALNEVESRVQQVADKHRASLVLAERWIASEIDAALRGDNEVVR